MARITKIVVAVAALGLTFVAANALATVGGPPTNHIQRCDGHARPCGKPYVLAEGRQIGDSREIVGFKGGIGTCLSFESVELPNLPSPCDEDVTPVPKRALRVEFFGTASYAGGGTHGGRTWTTTEIGGVLRPEVARVRATFFRRGTKHKQEAIVGQVDRDLARRVGFKATFGAFDLVMRGKPGNDGRPILLQTFTANGRLLDSAPAGR